jgi:hypothetical protein
MRKNGKKLTLARETVAELTGGLRVAQGGATLLTSCNETVCQTCRETCGPSCWCSEVATGCC